MSAGPVALTGVTCLVVLLSDEIFQDVKMTAPGHKGDMLIAFRQQSYAQRAEVRPRTGFGSCLGLKDQEGRWVNTWSQDPDLMAGQCPLRRDRGLRPCHVSQPSLGQVSPCSCLLPRGTCSGAAGV